jgi:hypothetical protein
MEQAAKAAGFTTSSVPFTPGRPTPPQNRPTLESFAVLEPRSRRFRNYLQVKYKLSKTEELMIDRAQLLGLTAPQMTVLVGGLRVLGANHNGSKHGVFTDRSRPADQRLLRQPAGYVGRSGNRSTRQRTSQFVGTDRKTRRRTALDRDAHRPGVRLQLAAAGGRRGLCAVRGCQKKFVKDFVKAWTKVMNNDRFDMTQAREFTPEAGGVSLISDASKTPVLLASGRMVHHQGHETAQTPYRRLASVRLRFGMRSRLFQTAMLPTLRQLQYLKLLAEHASFSRAADAASCQPAGPVRRHAGAGEDSGRARGRADPWQYAADRRRRRSGAAAAEDVLARTEDLVEAARNAGQAACPVG